LAYFEQAVHTDSNFAQAYSGIADVYISHGIGNMGDFRPDEYFPKARTAARRALAIDSLSPEALTADARVAMFYDLDWAAAERRFSRALELDPHYRMARAYHAVLLEYTGRFDAAIAEARATHDDDPLSSFASIEASRALFFGRQYDPAITQLRHLLDRDSTLYRAHLLLGQVLEQVGQLDSAIAEMQRAARLAPNSSRTHAFLAHAFALGGRTDDALRELGALQERGQQGYVPAFDYAVVFVGLGRTDEVFFWLDRALAEHSIRPYLMDATFDPIRSDPRYQRVLKAMNLPQGVSDASRV
jgi:tetratricopeptide (TPR) repeat protein